MRFDDRIATVLAAPAGSPAARIARWRQLVDLIAQSGPDDSVWIDAGCEALCAGRAEIPLATRREVAHALQGRRVAPRLIALLADDHPTVAALLIATAILTPAEWLALLPRLTPTARLLLRNRRDLAPAVRQGLESFGAVDLALPDAAGRADDRQIRDLVARIEAFQKTRVKPATAEDPKTEAPDAFRWESRSDGVLDWIEGAPRGALLGLSIATVADRDDQGVDGQAAGAHDKRSPFRDARLRVAGMGAASGAWLISGVPTFDQATGAFTGYRGSARRPRVDEVAAPQEVQPHLFGTHVPADSLRQLVHELRTPLNSIVGFAEMIEGQYLGPATTLYRLRAGDVGVHARRLLTAIDDLDTAARVAAGRYETQAETVDVAAMLARLIDYHVELAARRGLGIAPAIASSLPLAVFDAGLAERMMSRLLSAILAVGEPGETIGIGFDRERHENDRLLLRIARPQSLNGMDEAAILDPAYSPDGDWPDAPALGLGFALRLVRSLAEAGGGRLVIQMQEFQLYLPAVASSERTIEAEV